MSIPRINNLPPQYEEPASIETPSSISQFQQFLQNKVEKITRPLLKIMGDTRPNALILQANDSSIKNHVIENTFKDLEKDFYIKRVIINDMKSACQTIDNEKESGYPPNLVIIFAHGKRGELLLDPSKEHSFQIGDPLPKDSCFHNLPKNATILLLSCATGVGGDKEINIANYIAANAPKTVRILAPDTPFNNFKLTNKGPIDLKYCRYEVDDEMEWYTKKVNTYVIDSENRLQAIKTLRPNQFKELWNMQLMDEHIDNSNLWKPMEDGDDYCGDKLPNAKPLSIHRNEKKGNFLEINIEKIADKLIDIASDLTGVSSITSAGKEVKQMLVDIISYPENAPKMLLDKVLSQPKKLFEKAISQPKQFLQQVEQYGVDPSICEALNVVGTAAMLVSTANEILPILTRVSAEAFKDPFNVPFVVSKELLNLTTQKIIGLYKLVEGLVTDPLKTVERTLKGVARSPKDLVRNVKNLFGHGRRKAKRAKHRAKKKMEQALVVKQKFAQDMALEQAKILQVLPSCFCLAKQQWMINENTQPEDYLFSILSDWKVACSQGKYQDNCSSFIRNIYFKLKEGFFREVSSLSPTAHASSPIPPVEFLNAIKECAENNSKLAEHLKLLDENCARLGSETVLLKQAAEEDSLNTEALKQDREKTAQVLAELTNEVNTLSHLNQSLINNTPRLAGRLAGMMSAEEKVRMQNALRNNV